jgi:hypothetical protein
MWISLNQPGPPSVSTVPGGSKRISSWVPSLRTFSSATRALTADRFPAKSHMPSLPGFPWRMPVRT